MKISPNLEKELERTYRMLEKISYQKSEDTTAIRTALQVLLAIHHTLKNEVSDFYTLGYRKALEDLDELCCKLGKNNVQEATKVMEFIDSLKIPLDRAEKETTP